MKRTIFVDMDGVLADLETGFLQVFGRKKANTKPQEDKDWAQVRALPDFFANLPPMPDMRELWAEVQWHHPFILTGVPKSMPEAGEAKRAWVAKNLGPIWAKRTICCLSKEKFTYCLYGDILIDDWERYKDLWTRAGGTWITHVSAAESIAALRKLGM